MGRLSTNNKHFPGRRTSLGSPASQQQMAEQPPQWAVWLLSRFCPNGLEDELQGDLLEMYTYWLKTVGVSKARWRYTLAVFRLIRPFTTSRAKPQKGDIHPEPRTYLTLYPFQPTMLANYLQIAFRHLMRHKVYSFINMAGLSIGLACAMLIMLYVKDEVSFDRFHKNVHNIYRIAKKSKNNDENGSTGFLQGPRFSENIPGIKSFVRVQGSAEDIKKGTAVQQQDRVLHVDPNFFSVFSFPLIAGNPATCLQDPHAIVLSEDAAMHYFASTEAVGHILLVKEDTSFVSYKVTAVAKRCPQNSSLQFEALLPFKVSDADAKDTHNWFNSFLSTFIVLDEKVNPQAVEKQMQRFYVADAKQTFYEMLKIDGGDPSIFSMGTYFLQPYRNVHFNMMGLFGKNSLTKASHPIYSYLLAGIALFILLIACINFVNITIARSVKRTKEIGIRKVVGSNRSQLIIQFLGESFFLCAVAFLVAIALVNLVLPLFNELTNKALAISYLFDIGLITGYISLFLITGLLSGFYPALVLSGYNPVKTLYSRFQIVGKNYLQKSLVVLQFTLASFLIIATWVIYAQSTLLTETDLGYDDTNLVVLNTSGLSHSNVTIFKNELLKNASITGIGAKNAGSWATLGKNAAGATIIFQSETIDGHYLPVLKIPLIAGRNFSADYPADSIQSVIVNESFVKAAKWKHALGEQVTSNHTTYRVIGVVKDYHFASLTQKIKPQLFSMNGLYGTYYIKIKPNTAAASLKWIQKIYQQFYPMQPYAYVFKSDQNRMQYAEVEKWKQIILFGAILTIFISCIGLFGLAVLSAEKRTKEIGIRKVMGASVQHIVTILSVDFIKLVVVALIIASPAVYLSATTWLNNYPYRITLNGWMFALTGLLVVLIALCTVSFQSIKAAIANPVKSLRAE